jgi:hypothetical protein
MTRACQRLLARASLALLIIAATWPSWRLLMLDSAPTDNELLQLRCSSTIQEGRNAGAREATRARP